jgi:hypothetical protein
MTSVLEHLRGLRGLTSLQHLFCSVLGYCPANRLLVRDGWSGAAATALAADPVCLATAGEAGGFQVIYARLNSNDLHPGRVRAVVSRLMAGQPFALFVFSNASQDRWQFVNAPAADPIEQRRLLRHLTIDPSNPLALAVEKVVQLSLTCPGAPHPNLSPATIQQRHDQVFDVATLTHEFMADCATVFDELKAVLAYEIRDENQARAEAYRTLQQWLLAAFLQTEDTSFEPGVETLFAPLRRYPLTLPESHALEREFALDPEVLGLVAGRLAGRAPGGGGIVYTPRTEIDLMCRLALVDHLATHLGQSQRQVLHEAVFALEPDEQVTAGRALTQVNLWPALAERLDEITVLDPACGAGSFLVGMLRLLDDLQARAGAQLGRTESPLERKRRIISRNLYGVDVMARACEAADLRLKLALLAGPTAPGGHYLQPGPGLLPQVAGNVAVADSLTQPVFPKIAAAGRGGFDLVIGNPPYVRHEDIADPRGLPGPATVKRRKAYKRTLARAVHQTFPDFFSEHKIDGRSDLYIYFCFRGLSFLNATGTFCFLTASAWLDVAYGSVLQEFLLRQCRLKLILENEVRRSFAADVNTLILLASAPGEHEADGPSQMTRFVTLKIPFERAFSAELFLAIEQAVRRQSQFSHRVLPLRQRELLEGGLDRVRRPDPAPNPGRPPYVGGGWGGKYLRAPDIYWTIRDKCREKLVRLGDLAQVRFGVKTGANAFFYLDAARVEAWGLEDEFLRPVLFSLREIGGPEAVRAGPRLKLFSCHRPLSALESTSAAAYVEWGQAQGFADRRTCHTRPLWYSVAQNWRPAPFIFPAKIGQRMVVLRNRQHLLEDKKLYGLTPRTGSHVYWAAVLNSTLCRFLLELSCRQLTGAQTIADVDVAVVKALPIPHPKLLSTAALAGAYRHLAATPVANRVRDEYNRAERRALDDPIFDVLGLDRDEREAVYKAIIELVEGRLQKAAT